MSKEKITFSEWWESKPVKRFVGGLYSVGAAIVIVGALFKIMHFPGAGLMLSVGMIVEAFLFALGVFDKPHVEYKWEYIFPSLTGEEAKPLTTAGTEQVGGQAKNSLLMTGNTAGASLGNVPGLKEEEIAKLTNGIKNLSETANQLASLSTVVGSTEKFSKSLLVASEAADNFTNTQQNLTVATKGLETSYQSAFAGMDQVAKNTSAYAEKTEQINVSLSSINSVYELQLKNIQAQNELYSKQREKVTATSNHLDSISEEIIKIQQTTIATSKANEKYHEGLSKLSEQVADLSKVYGNMLNALS